MISPSWIAIAIPHNRDAVTLSEPVPLVLVPFMGERGVPWCRSCEQGQDGLFFDTGMRCLGSPKNALHSDKAGKGGVRHLLSMHPYIDPLLNRLRCWTGKWDIQYWPKVTHAMKRASPVGCNACNARIQRVLHGVLHRIYYSTVAYMKRASSVQHPRSIRTTFA
jgi:hypothetical protein